MGRLSQIMRKLHYRLKPSDAVKIARKIGVRFTAEPGKERCRILSEPSAVFGSEPYLVTIGEHVEITAGCVFITHDGGVWSLRNDERYKNLDIFGPIKIGNNVFIGNNSIVLPGVTIGDNVVIGAGSVVSRDILANSVAAGVPARVIRSLEEYGERSAKKDGAFDTKRLSSAEKKKLLQEEKPEWFE